MTEGRNAGRRVDLDEAIDLVVRDMMSAEPPAALRDRVMARLAGHEGRVPDQTNAWRRPVWAIAASLVVASLAWSLWPTPPSIAPASREASGGGVAGGSTSAALTPPAPLPDDARTTGVTPDRGLAIEPDRQAFASAMAGADPATPRARAVPPAGREPSAPQPAEGDVAGILTVEPLETPEAVVVEALRVDRLAWADLSVSSLEIADLEFSPLTESWR